MARNNPALPLIQFAAIRYTVITSYLGQLYEHFLDYLAGGPVTLSPTVLGAFDTAWRAANLTTLQATTSADVTFLQSRVADLFPSTTPTLVNAFIAKMGTETAHPLPGPDAAIITKRTNVKGQHGRGRSFMPWVPTTFTSPATDPNVVNATGLTAYSNYCNAIINPLTAGGAAWQVAITSRVRIPQIVVSNGTPVESFTVETVLGTVRRRREGRGI